MKWPLMRSVIYFLFLKNAVRFDYSQNLFDAKSVSVKRRLVRLKTADCGGGGGGGKGRRKGLGLGLYRYVQP